MGLPRALGLRQRGAKSPISAEGTPGSEDRGWRGNLCSFLKVQGVSSPTYAYVCVGVALSHRAELGSRWCTLTCPQSVPHRPLSVWPSPFWRALLLSALTVNVLISPEPGPACPCLSLWSPYIGPTPTEVEFRLSFSCHRTLGSTSNPPEPQFPHPSGGTETLT